jgi:L-threonylcarbamoyladenylate synthase|tara:strand:- start:26258 stop:26803 length:546 start_codon:yes stop_codon:yes gene_type:complete
MRREIIKILEILKKGGVILYPTDTIWGLGCDATNEKAISRIYKIKKRDINKPMISLVSDTNMLYKYTNSKKFKIPVDNEPTTIIYNDVKNLPKSLVTKEKTAAFRISSDIFCQKLIKEFGYPIVSTSANISGKIIPKEYSEITNEIKDNVDYIVNLRRKEIMDKESKIILINNDGVIKIIR